jgi:hypothetical protein
MVSHNDGYPQEYCDNEPESATHYQQKRDLENKVANDFVEGDEAHPYNVDHGA